MRLRLFLASMAAAAVVSHAHADPAPQQDMALFQKVAEATDQAWNAADAGAMSSYFTEDATLRIGSDAIQRGRDSIREFFQGSFARRPAPMRHVTQINHVEVVAPRVAIAELTVVIEQKGSDETWKAVHSFHNYSTLRREGNEWRIVHVRAIPRS